MRPPREPFRQSEQTYFITFQTAQRWPFFRRERWTGLFLEILQQYGSEYVLHDFVIMEDHIHLLLTPVVPVERAVQLIKGGFSFKAKRLFEWKFDIWQPGFSDHRIRDEVDYQIHRAYIAKNVRERGSTAFALHAAQCGFCSSEVPLQLKPPC